MNAEERRVRAACRTFLSGHRPHASTGAWLQLLASSPHAEGQPDFYGEGGPVQALEEEVAQLLGKQRAVFAITGTSAQQAALRVWTDQTARPVVALHPRSHIDLDEANAIEWLHGLHVVRLGGVDPFTPDDLATVTQPLGAVSIELPLRRAGFRLPPWDDLVRISNWCRERTIPLHLDGARLWESAVSYQRSLPETSALFDSVYVSFYKGLGGLAGCALAGTEDFIEQTRPWLARHGAVLHTAFPYAIAAIDGLRRHLPQMAAYRQRAQNLARALGELPDLHVVPDPPHTNAFQVYLPGTVEQLRQAHLDLAKDKLSWLFNRLTPSPLPDLTMAEIQVGEATADLTDNEAAALISDLIDRVTPPADDDL